MKNFVLSEAKAGKPVVTADGKPARIVCFDAKGPFPLVVLVSDEHQEFLYTYTEEGRYYLVGGSINDLMMKDDVCDESPAKQERWIDNKERKISGYYVSTYSSIVNEIGVTYDNTNRNIFATKRQAQSALAFAQLTQIIANDPRFGGPLTDEELTDNSCLKYYIRRNWSNDELSIRVYCTYSFFTFIAFHTEEQAELFLDENESLLKEYFMI